MICYNLHIVIMAILSVTVPVYKIHMGISACRVHVNISTLHPLICGIAFEEQGLDFMAESFLSKCISMMTSERRLKQKNLAESETNRFVETASPFNPNIVVGFFG